MPDKQIPVPCALCRVARPLVRSHFVPASVYKILRDPNPGPGRSGDPVHSDGKIAVQTSNQERAFLLCSDCEQRFSKRGENIVMPQLLQRDGAFPLREVLRGQQSGFSDGSEHWYAASELSGLDVDAYMYFMASIAWRASAGPWKGKVSRKLRGGLGTYEEDFRLFLMDDGQLPKDTCLFVGVANEANPIPFALQPLISKESGYHVHILNLPGVEFRVCVGGNVDASIRALCHAARTPVFFALRSARDEDFFKQVARVLAGARKAGAFARWSQIGTA